LPLQAGSLKLQVLSAVDRAITREPVGYPNCGLDVGLAFVAIFETNFIPISFPKSHMARSLEKQNCLQMSQVFSVYRIDHYVVLLFRIL
jgi:hypothetical protein